MNTSSLDKVLASPKLPTLPTVAIKLLELTRDPDVDLSDIADLVQWDPALAAKILKTVNSSFYALQRPCPTIKRALTYLGLNTVKSLVLGFSLVDLTSECDSNFDLMDYWRRCVYSAAAARRIALVTGRCDPDEAFIAAMMQDVGMLAIHSVIGPEYGAVIAETNGNHLALPYTEADRLGFTHADAGARLGEMWALPGQIVDPIRQHHQRGTPLGDHREIVNAVILAYRISNIVTWPNHKQALDMTSAMAQTMFHMSVEDERAVLTAISDDVRELSDLLDVHLGDVPDINIILAEADEAIVRHDRSMTPSIEPMPGTTRPATHETLFDALTGVGSRRRFDGELATQFRDALSRGTSLGVILIDIDRFKSLTQALGPTGSDVVLQVVARRLEESLGNRGIVCRHGSEEFAALLPGVSRVDAARIAERVRRHIEHDHIDLPGDVEAVSVTASLGVAVMEPGLAARVDTPERLMKLADRAVYAAKRDGRNCVRVFNPKPGDAAA